MALEDMLLGGGLAAAAISVVIISLIIFVALYVYGALALMAIAKKTKTKNAWLAWIPIANFYLVTQMAKMNGLWTLILLAALIPFGNLVALGVTIWFFWIIAERIKYPGWTSLLLLIPVVNLVILGLWAWKKK